MHDPFSVLGVPPSATPAQLRAAYRRLALKHHPDRNPGDAEAAGRFKRIMRAYRAALRTPRIGIADAAPPAGPRPDRYGCSGCGDTFPFPEQCSRCGLALFDRHAGDPPERRDPRVDAWMTALEQRPVFEHDGPSDALPAPGVMAGTFLGAAGLVWTLGGPIGPALLFAGFAAYITLIEGHRFFEKPIA